jgi:hypothetical protein
MRFRTGLIIGMAIGYYLGTRAGRERYEQIEEWLDRVRTSTTYQDARTKLHDGLREGTTAARRLIEERTGTTLPPLPGESEPEPVGDPTFN